MIHETASAGFSATGAADAYERGRPPYPAAVVDRLIDVGRIGPGAHVVDLAAGTGRLTRMLIPSGARVVAIEPVAAMRDALRVACPGVDVLDGAAESIPLPDGWSDAVTVGQAFHWFAGPAALAEIARVLRPGGTLALVWNAQRGLAPWIDRVLTIVHAANDDGAPQYDTGAWRAVFSGATAFGELAEHHVVSDWEVDVDTVLNRFASVSYVAALPDERRADLLAAIRALLDTDPATAGRARFPMPTRTDLFWCTKRS
ncbi:MAG: smtA [Acidimicrobiales bacterium]|nr:smtA [Acidimicrobiales bacterium]